MGTDDATILIIAHPRKLDTGSSQGHIGNAESLRGASSQRDAARGMATLYTPPPDDETLPEDEDGGSHKCSRENTMDEVVKNASSSAKAGPPPGLYLAEWLAAEAERLERVHDAIYRERDRLQNVAHMLKGEAGALNTEHMNLLGEVEQIVERKRSLMKRFEAEYTAPYTHLFDHLTANDWARVALLVDASRYCASKRVQGVFRDHKRRRKEEARLRRAERGTRRGASG